jgi:hypothetical protein
MPRRVPGEFVPCDVNLASDGGIVRAGPMPELIYRRALEYVKRADRDGLIYAAELGVIAHGIPGRAATHAEALVREGLWEAVEGGWSIRSWLKWNLSQAEVEDVRRRKQVGAIKTNHKRHVDGGVADMECPLCRGEKVA